jgi:four helix bundle protein
MPTIKRFEEIEAWQTARNLTKLVYGLSSEGAFSRDFALRDQMRRASISILSNIAEGFDSRTRGLFTEFLGRAKGSAGELRAQFYVALDAAYLTQEQFLALSDQCEKCSSQISRLMVYLRNLPNSSSVERSNVPTSKRSNDSSGVQRSNVSTFKRSNDA